MIAIVGTPVVDSSGSASAATLDSPALSTTTGNSLLVGCASQEGDFVGTTIDSVTDTAGNTFLPLTFQGSGGAGTQIIRWFYCHNIIGHAANVATGTWSAATRYRHIIQIEFSGAKNQAPIDEGGDFALGVSTCPVSIDMGSTTGAVFSYATSSNDRTWTPGTGFTEISDWGASSAADYYTGFNATGTVTADMVPAAATNISLVAVGFEEAPTASAEQEGFRFGTDDAAESSHGWAQAQDTDDTVTVGTARLIRAIVNGSGDLPSAAYALRVQKNGAGGYSVVPVGATIPAVYGTVTFGAIGTGSNGSTAVTPSYPAGITAGQYLTCHVSSGATNSETPTTPSGWTLLATGASTDGTFGVDTGPRRMTVFGKIADGTESGTLTVSITNGNTCRGTIARWTKSGSGSWDVVGQGANDSTSGTGFSATTASINWNTGDAAIAAVGQRVDTVTQSSQSLTATGVTFGARTNRASTAVTTGNDHRHVVDTFAAVTSTSNVDAAPTWAFTGSAACSGGLVIVRLREYTAAVTNEIYVSPSSNISSGGEATTARLTAPSGKTTSDFTTGRRWDDENGTDSIDIASDFYTELEWCVNTQAPAADGDYFEFRVYAGSSPIASYTVTPKLTLGTAGGTICNPMTGIGGAAARPLAA